MTTRSDIYPTAAGGSSGRKDPSVIFGVVGAVCIAVALGLLLLLENPADPSRYFAGYLLGVSFWISILIGMLFLTMIFWLFDAGWAVIVRRQLEHALSGLLWIGLALLPLLLIAVFSDSAKVAWTWTNLEALDPSGHGTVGEDVLWQKKGAYLDAGFFAIRFIFVFVTWGGLAYLLRRWSFRMDETGDHKYIYWSRRLAAGGVFLCALATTLASIDWFKSLNYHWFSTMYGVWFFSASMRAALSASVLILFWQGSRREGGLAGILQPAHTHLIACLMLAFTVFWAYISFSQFFIIYNANIPEETFWYNIRELTSSGGESGWYIISRMLIFLHFFAPFLLLLWYGNKFGWRLTAIAVWILFFHFVDLIWNILPQKLGDTTHESASGYFVRPLGMGVTIVDVLAWIGAGGICVWAFLRSVNRYRAIPIRDPRINESLNYHG